MVVSCSSSAESCLRLSMPRLVDQAKNIAQLPKPVLAPNPAKRHDRGLPFISFLSRPVKVLFLVVRAAHPLCAAFPSTTVFA